MTFQIDPSSIENALVEATKLLPVIWPLSSQIAVNPLWDLRDKSLSEALQHAKQFLNIKGTLRYGEYVSLYQKGIIKPEHLARAMNHCQSEIKNNVAHIVIGLTDEKISTALSCYEDQVCEANHKLEQVRDQVIDFMNCYFDENLSSWYTKSTRYSLYTAWKEHAQLVNQNWHTLFLALPDEPIIALQKLLVKMNYSSVHLTKLFSYLLCQLIGWHGFIKWLSAREANPFVKQEASFLELVLIWCCYCYQYKIDLTAVITQTKREESLFRYLSTRELPVSIPSDFQLMTFTELTLTLQRAYELAYEDELVELLCTASQKQTPTCPSAQFIFCIDTRSEVIRRHLEKNNQYETFSYAGFFGSFFSLTDDENNEHTIQAPALVEPALCVHKQVVKMSFGERLTRAIKLAFKRSKSHLLSPFAFFEMIGAWMSLSILSKTFFSKACNATFEEELQHDNPFLAPDQVEVTAKNIGTFLKTIGLTKQLAPWIFICGHEATTNNNPYQASFACGACGGNSGFINAKIACQILNDVTIRKLLIAEGIHIPEKTQFVPASHKTTVDELVIDNSAIPKQQLPADIIEDIQLATSALKAERNSMLPGGESVNDRATHWAELVPEWGLANNAALIIGPRRYTAKVNLQGRTFLHSYNPDVDTDGTLLEGILTAPLVVAHWINAQYNFSATDPEIYGAGNKAIHNVIGKIGVIEGNKSDLKIGLPLQSVFYQNHRVHQPLKLLVVIFSQLSKVNEVLCRQPQIKALFDNGWINLRVIQSEC